MAAVFLHTGLALHLLVAVYSAAGHAGGLWSHGLGACILLALSPAAIFAGRRSRVSPRAEREGETESGNAERLFAFIQSIARLDAHLKPGPQLALLVQSIFGLEAVAILDADLQDVYRAGEWFEGIENLVQNTYLFETVHEDAKTGLVRRVLRMGSLPIGAMVLRGEPGALVADAIASLVAISFDRYHAFANESRTERARQTEQLRTTVLDSLAHAYKTPLTAIRVASTGLNEMGNLTPAQSGLVALIDEQSGLLNQLTTRLLKTARLEAQELALDCSLVAILPLIEDAVADLGDQLACLSVQINVARDDLSLVCDRGLVAAMLTQYLENAGKYATAGTTVTVEAAEQPGEIVFSVHNLGPAIPVDDHERVFDRYFRSSAPSNKTPGTGLGLSVAKHAVQMQGGSVWVNSDERHGTTFFASLPARPLVPLRDDEDSRI